MVIDRYGTIGLKEEHPPVDRVLTQLDAFEMFCSECTRPDVGGSPRLIASAHPKIQRPTLLEPAQQQMEAEDARVAPPACERRARGRPG